MISTSGRDTLPQVSSVSRKFCNYTVHLHTSSPFEIYFLFVVFDGFDNKRKRIGTFSPFSQSLSARDASWGKSTEIFARDTLMLCEWGFILCTWSIEKKVFPTPALLPCCILRYLHSVSHCLWNVNLILCGRLQTVPDSTGAAHEVNSITPSQRSSTEINHPSS